MDAAASSPNKRRRLVVCLDGTWNRRDDSTNVFHHFTLAFKGIPPDDDGIAQLKYYRAGVGTGPTDKIFGGGFGIGLEANVRKAYDWLVENFHDDPLEESDEIYVFGFSRGAYTARSLVGFISTFGLLRRGAPLSVNELWQHACIIGREREERRGVWDRIFGAAPKRIRRITQLVGDPWSGSEPRADDLTPEEKLLVRWSRRVRITYLGVYDTVGAMGVDALAIPGLKSKLAMHHNLRATTLIQHCRHALALDEHRSSFLHTPFLQYLGHGASTAENRRLVAPNESPGNGSEESAAMHWQGAAAMWRRKIEQRWFVGAHSNVGGGYPDNELALHPLRWLLQGARDAGLQSEELPNEPPITNPLPCDSYSEFVKPFWTQVIRGKRFYRTIDPEPRLHGPRPDKKRVDELAAGFSLQTINEQVDETVFACVASHAGAKDEYHPPNLFEYASRKLEENPAPPDAAKWKKLTARRPEHVWLRSMPAHLIMLLWATGAGAGIVAIKSLFIPQIIAPWLLASACAAAFAFAVIDWLEAWANFRLALGPTNPRRRALLDTVYWLRSLGFVLFSLGTIATVWQLWALGWYAGDFPETFIQTFSFIVTWWLVPVAAGIGILLANFLERAPAKRQGAGLIGSALGILAAAVIAFAVIVLGWLVAQIITPALGRPLLTVHSPAERADFAGLLLLLQLGCLCLLNTYRWVGEPMRNANLGTIMKLQRCVTPNGVNQQLEAWRQCLACRWSEADRNAITGPAGRAVRAILRESLWRDIFGFVPSYVIVLGFGLWFAAGELGWHWLSLSFFRLPLWLLLPVVALLADYFEDCCHLRYLALHKRGAKPFALLPPAAATASLLKFAFLALAIPVTLWTIVQASLHLVAPGPSAGWRGTAALILSVLAALAILAIVIGAILYRLRTRFRKDAR